jgi:isopenicillin-N epimerase
LTTAEQFTDTLIAGMTERTKVLFLSHITSPTALLFPIEAVVAEARRRGIWSVIDGAHTPGHIKLDLDAIGADFYAGNCHKWMMAPKGSAFLYARPELQGLLNPLVISHGWTAESKEAGAKGAFGNSPFIDEIEMQGTRDPAAWLAVTAALDYRRENDWWDVSAHCQALAQDTARRLADITGLPALSSPEFSAPQMVAMPIPECDVDWLKVALLEQYKIEIPVFKWQDHHIARVSVQGYNSKGQMDLLIEALSTLLNLNKSAARSA